MDQYNLYLALNLSDAPNDLLVWKGALTLTLPRLLLLWNFQRLGARSLPSLFEVP